MTMVWKKWDQNFVWCFGLGTNGLSSRLLNHLLSLFSFYMLLKASKNHPENIRKPLVFRSFQGDFLMFSRGHGKRTVAWNRLMGLLVHFYVFFLAFTGVRDELLFLLTKLMTSQYFLCVTRSIFEKQIRPW